MRHLAIFLPSLDGGGAEKVTLALAERFVARGTLCDLVIATPKGKLLNKVPKGVNLVTLNKGKTITSLFSLARYIRRERPDTILSAVFAANLCAILAAKIARRGTRIVTSEVSPTSFDMASISLRETIVNKIAARALYPLADNIIAVSKGIRSSILENKLANPSRVNVIYNPIIEQSGDWIDSPQTTERTIVSCGRLDPQKDYPTLLRAFKLVRKTHDVKLIILGEGSLRHELEVVARHLGLSEDVEFVGFASNPLHYMKNADVFVHTAIYEGFGVVLLEALTVGCPIVATDCPGGVREVLAGGKFGTLVPVKNDKAISEAITEILDGKKSFPNPTEHLRQFNIENITDSYLEVLFPATQQ